MKTNKKLATLTFCKNIIKYFVAVALLKTISIVAFICHNRAYIMKDLH